MTEGDESGALPRIKRVNLLQVLHSISSVEKGDSAEDAL